MIAVIFEVTPAEGALETYLEHAAQLKPDLEAQDGFVSVERFRSLSEPHKLLSLSFFEDEAAVAKWRAQHRHRATQSAARRGIFENYRLRVAHVLRDYGLNKREEAPSDSRDVHG